jgi:uncharacterized protein YbdZ (MbtH family)
MTDLDEDSVGAYLLLVDGGGRYMLWPSIKCVPREWCIVEGPASRRDCLASFRRESAASPLAQVQAGRTL